MLHNSFTGPIKIFIGKPSIGMSDGIDIQGFAAVHIV